MTLGLKKSILVLASFAVIAAGCQIESISEAPVLEEAVEFSAASESYGPATKTSMSGLNVVWSENDELAVFRGNNIADRFEVTAESVGDTYAKLNLAEEVSDGDQISANVACYPYSSDLMLVENMDAVVDGNNILMLPDGTYSLMGFVFPTTQTYTAGSFANGAFPMVAVTTGVDDRSFEMKNILGALKLQLTGKNTVKSITVSGNNYESIAGPAQSVRFAADSEPVVHMSADEPSATSVTLDCGEGVDLNSSSATDFVITLVPTVFEYGFKVTVVDTDGMAYQIVATAENEIQRSKVLVMPEIDMDDMTPVLEVVTDPGFTDVDIEMELLVEDAVGFYGIFAPKNIWEIYANAFIDPTLVDGLFTGGFEDAGLPCIEYFDTYYEGKLSHFGLDPYLVDDEYCNAVYPNSSYYLVIVPIFDDKDEYTLNDFIPYEVQTLSLEKGGNVKLPNYTVAEGYLSSKVSFDPSDDISMVMYRIYDADAELPTEENYLNHITETADYSSQTGFEIEVISAPGVLPGAAYKVCVVLADASNKTSLYTVDVKTKELPYDESVTFEISDPVYTKNSNRVSSTVTYPDGAVKLYYVINHQMIIDDYNEAVYVSEALLNSSSTMKSIDLAGKSNPVRISGTAEDNLSRDVMHYAHVFVLMNDGKVSHLVTSNGVLAEKRM